jgi:DNA-binding CsgD family transcriptional regulator
MLELPPGGQRVVAEVAQIAFMSGRIDQRAEALLEPLRRVVPFRGAWISLLEPERCEQPPLVSQGYPDGLNRYMSGPAGVAEIELLGLNRSGGATRLSDLRTPLEDVPSWAEYLAPAGFRGGVVAGLFAADGRYLGMLGLNTDTAGHPTEAARDLISVLAPTIAFAIDPMRMAGAAARVVGDAQAAIVLTRAGNTLALPGLPGHPLLDPGSAVLTVASAHLAVRHDFVTFLCPIAADGPHSVRRITVLGCGGYPPGHLRGIVVVSPPGDTQGLDQRELEILGLLIDDWSDQRIAAALDLPPLIVAESVERILTKLNAPTRIVATLRALRQGLYTPRALIPDRA